MNQPPLIFRGVVLVHIWNRGVFWGVKNMTYPETEIAYPLNVGCKYDAFPFRIIKISGAFAVSSREATLE